MTKVCLKMKPAKIHLNLLIEIKQLIIDKLGYSKSIETVI